MYNLADGDIDKYKNLLKAKPVEVYVMIALKLKYYQQLKEKLE